MRRPFASTAMLAFSGSPNGSVPATAVKRFNRHPIFSLDPESQFKVVPLLLDALPMPKPPILPSPKQHPNPTVKRKNTYAMIISYNGAAFPGGYEINPSFPPDHPTVQGTITDHILSLTGMTKLWVATAGRTDAKVSAKGGLLSFAIRESIEPDLFVEQLNARLQSTGEMKVHRVQAVDATFHAAFGTTAREYLYILPVLRCEHSNSQSLQKLADVADCLLSAVVGEELDYVGISAGKIKTATTLCTFENAGCWYYSAVDTEGNIMSASMGDNSEQLSQREVVPGFAHCWEKLCHQYNQEESEESELGGCIVFKVKSNRFLRRQMRKLINSVLLDASEIIEEYQDCDRCQVFARRNEWENKWKARVNEKDRSGNDAAPPEGLCLWKVDVLQS